MRQDFDAPA